MRIYIENTAQYIYSLANSISKDPASLDSWKCLHIKLQDNEPVSNSAIDKIKEENKEKDCDIIVCSDNDILLISRELNALSLHSLAVMLTANMNEAPEIEVYDLFRDWRMIHSLLLAKTRQITDNKQLIDLPDQSNDADNFGEVSSLTEIFLEAKNLRKARYPQYVMVVDDDPLTRRLIASSLKERYALVSAADAQEAVANYLFYAPDIVFLDINLPDASGFSVLQQIVASDPDAYVVMLSGNSYLDNVTKALNNGASGFISKPFRKEKLCHYIESSSVHHHKYA